MTDINANAGYIIDDGTLIITLSTAPSHLTNRTLVDVGESMRFGYIHSSDNTFDIDNVIIADWHNGIVGLEYENLRPGSVPIFVNKNNSHDECKCSVLRCIGTELPDGVIMNDDAGSMLE